MSDDERADVSPAEVRRRREQRLQSQSTMPLAEREQQRQQHFMRCPKCGGELDEMVFRSVRVDKCFACGGVYLDDGELEQLTGKPGWFEAMRKFFSRS
jgi:hypothetical protein